MHCYRKEKIVVDCSLGVKHHKKDWIDRNKSDET